MIKFEHVTKIYKEGSRPALDDISVDIDRGEFVFLVGASGSGKSTFLSLVLRSERANSGLIQVAGKNLGTLTNWRVPQYRQQLGIVFQNFRLLENKTVFENVAFALQVIGKPKHTIQTLVPEALAIVGLQGKENRYPHQLSGGEQQRVAIARAFVNRPLIILADEPTGNLDPTTSEEIMHVFEMISQTGTTIVMSTHSADIVNKYRKRVIELDQGKLVRDEEHARYDLVSDKEVAPELERSALKSNLKSAGRKVSATQNAPISNPSKRSIQNSVHQNSAYIPENDILNNRIPEAVAQDEVQNDESIENLAGNLTEQDFLLTEKLPSWAPAEDMYESFNEEPAPLFETGAFDATKFRDKNMTGAMAKKDLGITGEAGDEEEGAE